MNITFYYCSDLKQANKTNYLESIATFDNVIFKEGQSVTSPTLIIKSSTDISSNANYVFIQELNTYYFIENVEVDRANNYIFYLIEDGVFTYLNEVLELDCVVSRQEFEYNQYLDDSRYKVYNYERTQTFEFPQGLTNSNASFVLAICGGE